MSVEAVGRFMPEVITLDDLAAMITADTHGRRYETSPEGVLFVVPPPTSDHAIVASRLMGWLLAAGWQPEQVLQMVGVRIRGAEMDGGRVPDLTLWSRTLPGTSWQPTNELVLAVEIISRGSEGIDQVLKVAEYARAGIPRYWTVARDEAQTVTLYRLADDQGIYETTAQMSLRALLARSPEEFIPPAG